MSKLNKADIAEIAYHCNNCYPDKYKTVPGAISFKRGAITGYSIKTKGTLYIYIAGTDEMKDVLTDIRLIPSHFNGEADSIKVHRGFEKAFIHILPLIKELCAHQTHVVIAGHSMGGAIATLAAYKMASSVPYVTCVTFGSPRVGNRSFTKEFNKLVTNSYRIVHRNDAVTKWPKLLWWYRHVGKLYQSKRKRWFSFFTSLFDHPMQEYIDGINKDMWKF